MTKLKQQLALTSLSPMIEETAKCNQIMLESLLIISSMMYAEYNKQSFILHR